MTDEPTSGMADEMACAELVELVTAFLDGELDAATERRFVAHLARCEGCERYLDQFRQTIRAIGRLSPAAMSPRARQRMLAAFRDWRAG